ncbi:hypothetical protein AAG570_004913 [Ranatra chinensis]|uniref:Uncharacterized protein n=1 Tax=Ranatra chinensis TaxID=642074 RepID=A0ABD0XYX6_9HEMI
MWYWLWSGLAVLGGVWCWHRWRRAKGRRGGHVTDLRPPPPARPLAQAADRPLPLLLLLADARICRGGDIDSNDLVARFATDYFARIVYGVDSDAFDRQDSVLMRVAYDFLRHERVLLPSGGPAGRLVAFFRQLGAATVAARKSGREDGERNDLVAWALQTIDPPRTREDGMPALEHASSNVWTAMALYFCRGVRSLGAVLGRAVARVAADPDLQEAARGEVSHLLDALEDIEDEDRVRQEERLRTFVEAAASTVSVISEELQLRVHSSGRSGDRWHIATWIVGLVKRFRFLGSLPCFQEDAGICDDSEDVIDEELVRSVGVLVLAALLGKYKLYRGGSGSRRVKVDKSRIKMEPLMTKPHQC